MCNHGNRLVQQGRYRLSLQNGRSDGCAQESVSELELQPLLELELELELGLEDGHGYNAARESASESDPEVGGFAPPTPEAAVHYFRPW